MNSVNILIADDSESVRRSLRSLIETRPEWRICGEAADGLKAVEKSKQLRPDIVLMDISMPGLNGLEATRLIRQELPQTSVIVVSQNDPAVAATQVTKAGAYGYVSKSSVVRDLFPMIETIVSQNGGKEISAVEGSTAAKSEQEQTSSRKPARRRSNRSKPDAAPAARDWMLGGGEMGERMRSLDWSQTALGPIEQWPQSLKTSISICLASRFPIVMYWGPEYVVLYNDAYRAILGSKHPWALGQGCSECWAEIWDTIGPMLNSVVDSAQATWSNDLLLLLRRNGYREECYFSFSFSPIRIETGAVGGVFTAVMETSEKVIGERRLRTLRDLAARAVDANTEDDAWRIAIQTLAENFHDLPFSILCEVSGAERAVRVLGSAGIDSAHPLCTLLNTAGSELNEKIRHLEQSREIAQVELTAERFGSIPQGAWRVPAKDLVLIPLGDPSQDRYAVLLAAVSPHKDLNHEYRTFFQLVAQQIATSVADARAHDDERKRAEALAELDRAKTAFFNVSHEFRTPLTLMLAPLEDVLNSDSLELEQRERLEVAHRNSLRLLKLVNTLLDFSRFEAGRMQASYELTNICELTTELASVFRAGIERAGLRYRVECEPIAGPVYIDREMWEKIVFNLLSNAFKFTFEGEIEISLRQVENAVELKVKDSGTGIPAAELTHLFERFYRVQGAQGRTFEGSGIGLALVQELVKLHGGTVEVETQINRGSAFTVTIPLGKDQLPAERIGAARTMPTTGVKGEAYVQEALHWLPGVQNASFGAISAGLLPEIIPPASKPGDKPARILLADDNADMRAYVQRLLSPRHEVVAVGDGEAALQSARERQPDLIISDVMMPRLGGFGLLRAVRADEKLKQVPMILLSARAGEESRLEGLQSGADDYLVKPFSARELLARVKSQLDMVRMRRESIELEHKLRLDAELLAAIVTSSDDAIVSKNMDGVITSWNKGAEQIFGYTSAEAVGQHITLIIPAERREEETEILSRLRRGERIDHFETIRVRKDGTPLNISVSISPIRDPSGKIIGASKVARDITARRQAEYAAREHRERLEFVAQASQVGFWFCDLPFDKLIWDDRVKEHFWLPPEAEVTIETFYDRIHPDDREFTRRAIEVSIETDTPYDIEYRTVAPAQGGVKWIRASGRTFYDHAGKPIRFDGITMDITARKSAEDRERHITAEAIAANAKFRAVFEQTTVLAGIMRRDGTLIDANKMCLDVCGYSPPEVLGLPLWDAAWWRNFPESQERIRAATPLAAGGVPFRDVLHYSWADGSERLVDFALYPIVNDEGHVLFLHSTGVDITDLKRAEESYRVLAESLEAEVRARTAELVNRNAEVVRQSELVREFSHRLLHAQDEERRHIARELHDSAGQTLTVLGISIARLMQMAGRRAPEISAEAEKIQDTVKQLHREIRTTSYLLHPPLLDETGLASALNWYVQGLAERSDLEIRLEIPDDFGRLPRDLELAVFRLVQESLTNIHRHSGASRALIRIARAGNEIAVEVEDNGSGMSAAKVAEMQSGGSGVGIRGMRERLRQFEGKLDIESSSSGTRIRATVPLVNSVSSGEQEGIEPLEAAV